MATASDNFIRLHASRWSDALGCHVPLTVLLPDRVSGPHRALYLLHGMGDDQDTWLRRTALERHALGLGFAIVMPHGARAWWCDGPQGAYERLVLETVAFAERAFPLRRDRAGRAIAGTSMGGYGALRIGLKHARLFSAIAAVAPAADPERPLRAGNPGPLAAVFPDEVPADAHPFRLAERLAAKRASCPRLWIGCGRDDFVWEPAARFHRHLGRLKIPHTWHACAGAHFWDCWDGMLPGMLRWLAGGVR